MEKGKGENENQKKKKKKVVDLVLDQSDLIFQPRQIHGGNSRRVGCQKSRDPLGRPFGVLIGWIDSQLCIRSFHFHNLHVG